MVELKEEYDSVISGELQIHLKNHLPSDKIVPQAK